MTTTGMVNLPLSDSLALRATFPTTRHNGHLRAVNKGPRTGGNDRNDQDDVPARLSVLNRTSG